MFFLADRLQSLLDRGKAGPPSGPEPAREPARPPSRLEDHVVLIGYGRVGSVIGEEIRRRGLPLFVIDENQEIVDRAEAVGIEAVLGDRLPVEFLTVANIARALRLFVAIPNGFEAGQFVAQARALQPSIRIVARAHSDAEAEHLTQLGAEEVILGERETALGMIGAMFAGPERGLQQPSPAVAAQG